MSFRSGQHPLRFNATRGQTPASAGFHGARGPSLAVAARCFCGVPAGKSRIQPRLAGPPRRGIRRRRRRAGRRAGTTRALFAAVQRARGPAVHIGAPRPEPRRAHRHRVRRLLLRNGAGQRPPPAPAASAIERRRSGGRHRRARRSAAHGAARRWVESCPRRARSLGKARCFAARFRDSAAPTLVVHAAGVDAPAPGNAEILQVPVDGGGLNLAVLLERARARPRLRVCRGWRGDRVAVHRSGVSSIGCTSRSRRSSRAAAAPGSRCRRASALPSVRARRTASSRWAVTCCSTATCAPLLRVRPARSGTLTRACSDRELRLERWVRETQRAQLRDQRPVLALVVDLPGLVERSLPHERVQRRVIGGARSTVRDASAGADLDWRGVGNAAIVFS